MIVAQIEQPSGYSLANEGCPLSDACASLQSIEQNSGEVTVYFNCIEPQSTCRVLCKFCEDYQVQDRVETDVKVYRCANPMIVLYNINAAMASCFLMYSSSEVLHMLSVKGIFGTSLNMKNRISDIRECNRYYKPDISTTSMHSYELTDAQDGIFENFGKNTTSSTPDKNYANQVHSINVLTLGAAGTLLLLLILF